MNAPVRFSVVFGVLCIFLFLFSALPVQARDPADFEVILFENPGCVGENRLAFFYDNDLPNLNRFNLPGGEKWNDRISSLAIGKMPGSSCTSTPISGTPASASRETVPTACPSRICTSLAGETR